jgi:hypothetical protein
MVLLTTCNVTHGAQRMLAHRPQMAAFITKIHIFPFLDQYVNLMFTSLQGNPRMSTGKVGHEQSPMLGIHL